MAENRTLPVVVPSDAVLEQIHYDTLWSTAQDALALFAGKGWTARGDDDPGVTLMQGFSYGVSDVSYRHTLPLVDLLTPEAVPEPDKDHLDHSQGIFAPEFGPEWALTISPVTLEDYRRGILDLTVSVDGQSRFCFRDVQLSILPEKESYTYQYDPNTYAIQFAGTDGVPLFRVRGAYRLWVTLNPGVSQKDAQPLLKRWLGDHRNLCEWEIGDVTFSKIELSSPIVHLILDDDLATDKISQAVALAIWAMNQQLLPSSLRQPAEMRLVSGEPAEQVYNGPRLEYGWITQLAPARDLAATTIILKDVSQTVAGSVPGIRAVEWVRVDGIGVRENDHLQLWLDPAGQLNFAASASDSIRIYKRGQDITTSADAKSIIAAYDALDKATYLATRDATRNVPYGRYRNPGFYRSVGASLPPVYGLQQAADAFGTDGDKHAKNLLLFLRSYEQLLANSAEQLQSLPGVLAFDGRLPGSDVWGQSPWPLEQDDPLTYEQTLALLDKDIRNTLAVAGWAWSEDKEKELTIIDYLLGYFGETRAARTMGSDFGDPADFVAVQQGFLRQVTRIAGARSAISISKISALQRKIAARLGVGKTLFDERLQKADSAFPDEVLPFYLIEHQELMPKAPKMALVGDKYSPVTKTSIDENELKLTVSDTTLEVGQLIDIGEQGDNAPDPFMGVVFNGVDGNVLTISLNDNERLKRSAALFENSGIKWQWRVSRTWLRQVIHSVDFIEKKDDTATLAVTNSFPAGLKVKDCFALRPRGRWLYQPTKSDLMSKGKDVVVEVTEANPIAGTVKIKWVASADAVLRPNKDNPTSADPVNLKITPDGKADWNLVATSGIDAYAWSVPYTTENFSFTLSVVLNRDLLVGNNATELSQWIEKIVREEMPSHLNLQIHWIDGYRNFALQYKKWQNSGRPVGDQSYELLRLLGMGERPIDLRGGIGYVHVASNDEKSNALGAINAVTDADDKDGKTREQMLRARSVIYVLPPEVKTEPKPKPQPEQKS